MAESIDEDNLGNGGRDDGVDEEVDKVEDVENKGGDVEEADEEENEEEQAAWKEASFACYTQLVKLYRIFTDWIGIMKTIPCVC